MTAWRTEPLDGEQLADLLMRLLIDGSLRDRLAADGARSVAASYGELECLETVDLEELDVTVRRFRSKIWRLGCGGNLAATFPRSVRLLAAAGIDESGLLTDFLATEHFTRFRLVPYTGPGQSVEESFAAFLLDLVAAHGAALDADLVSDTITHELMISLCTALTREQPLSFVISAAEILRTGRGHAALRWYTPDAVSSWRKSAAAPSGNAVSYAYFCTPAGVAHGVVSAEVAMAFEATPTAAGDAARQALARRGLW